MNLGIIIPGIFQDCKNKFILLHLNLHICKMKIKILYSFSPCCDKISEVIRNEGFILAYGWRDVVHHDRTTWLQELEAPGHTVLALNASAQFALLLCIRGLAPTPWEDATYVYSGLSISTQSK